MTRTLALVALAVLFTTSASTPAAAQLPRWKTLPTPPPMPAPDESGLLPVNGSRMYYAIFNKRAGSPVILLHGGLGSSDDWGFETPLLDKTHEVIVVDCRGRGRSTMSSEPLTYELMASDVLSMMDQLEIRRASIVGSSDGGIIGLILAIHHPDRIDKLFAFGANFSRSGYASAPPDSALAAQYMARVQADYRRLSPTPDDFPKVRSALERMYGVEPELTPAELGTIRAPTVIADGEHEQFITRAHTEQLARLIPGAMLVIIPNVGHSGPIQDPVSFHRAVMNLLGSGRR